MMDNAWKLSEESRIGMNKKGWNADKPTAAQDNDIFGRRSAYQKPKEESGIAADAK